MDRCMLHSSIQSYLVDGVNLREGAETSYDVGLCHEVSSHEVSDRLVHQGISVLNVKLSEQPVCL